MKFGVDYFKFCPRCGGRLAVRRQGSAERLVCVRCHFVFYQNSKPTASAFIVNSQGQVLLVKRGVRPKFGYWDAFGGFLEDGEEPIRCLQREAREELGVSLRDIRYLGIYLDAYEHQYRLYTLNIVYQARISRGRLRAMSDVSAVQWFSKSKIPWSRLTFPHWMKPALHDWLKLQK